jgi:hypothetical protein
VSGMVEMSITRVDWNDAMVSERVSSGARDAHERASASILDRLAQTAPLDTGHLIGTAKAESDSEGAAISYDTHYAALVHEHPEWNFQNGREGKWLEREMNSSGDAVFGEYARALDAALR